MKRKDRNRKNITTMVFLLHLIVTASDENVFYGLNVNIGQP